MNERQQEITAYPKAEVICNICKSTFRTDEKPKQRTCNCGNIECDVNSDYIKVLDLLEKGYIYIQNGKTIYSPITLTDIYDKGTEVFGSLTKFTKWLLNDNIALENRKPIDVIKTEEGSKLVIAELKRIEQEIDLEILDTEEVDETSYLLNNPNNAKFLNESIKEIEQGKTISYTIDELKNNFLSNE